jgi:lysophospholipase L1-like esterase
MADVIRNLLTFLASALFALALLEIGTRTVVDDGMNFDLEMWKYASDIKVRSANPEIGHEHRPDRNGIYMGVPVATNALGLRDREITLAKEPGVTRVLMLGDSLTFGWGVALEDTPAKILERKLARDGKRIEVINAGVGNYNTSMEVAYFLDKGRKLAPDIVVLNYFINDAEETPRMNESALVRISAASVLLMGKADAFARAYLGGKDWKSYYSELYAHGKPAWEKTRTAIGALAEYCRRNGVGLLVADYPELHELNDYPFADVSRKIAAVAAVNRVPYVSLLPAVAHHVPSSLWVSPTDAHPNRIANEAFAREIERALRLHYPGAVGTVN